MHSADRVLPEFQELGLGDSPTPGMRVEILEPERVLSTETGSARAGPGSAECSVWR
jgi:hypothetical protein